MVLNIIEWILFVVRCTNVNKTASSIKVMVIEVLLKLLSR